MGVSEQHCTLTPSAQPGVAPTLTDTSANGTLVKGERVVAGSRNLEWGDYMEVVEGVARLSCTVTRPNHRLEHVFSSVDIEAWKSIFLDAHIAAEAEMVLPRIVTQQRLEYASVLGRLAFAGHDEGSEGTEGPPLPSTWRGGGWRGGVATGGGEGGGGGKLPQHTPLAEGLQESVSSVAHDDDMAAHDVDIATQRNSDLLDHDSGRDHIVEVDSEHDYHLEMDSEDHDSDYDFDET